MAFTNPLLLSSFVTPDAITRLTEFSYEFQQVYAAQPSNWAEQRGLVRLSNSILTRFPMSASMALFKKLVGDFEYRRLAQKFMTVDLPEPWQDGITELADVLEAPDFTGWGDEPSNMALQAVAAPSTAVAAALAAGKTANTWEDDYAGGVHFFDAAHPVNPLKSTGVTYKNLYTGFGLTGPNIDTVWQDVRKIKAPNGVTPRGLRLGGIMVPSTMERAAMRLCKDDRILVQSGSSTATVERYNNIKELNLEVIVCDELTEDDVWYPLVTAEGKGKPWIIQKRIPGLALPVSGATPAEVGAMNAGAPAPFEWIINDKGSALYKDGASGRPSGFVSIAAKLSLGITLAHPWTIYRCET
ncbi:MAG: hypothetical protein ABI134_31480 [Byssovorax sp.]